MMYLVSSRFPFTPISRLEFRLVSHFSPISCLEFCLVSHFSFHFSPRIALFPKNWSRPSLDSPTKELMDQFMNKYNITPYFALPRLPQQYLFALGGFSSAPSSSIEVYNSSSDQWSRKKPKLPLGLAYCTAQVMGAKIFVMGGVSVDPLTHGGVVSRKTFIIDINKGTIESSICMKEKTTYLSSEVLNTTIYLFGGKGVGQETSRLKSCERLDTSKLPLNWERIQPLEHGRADAGAAAVRGSIYLTEVSTPTFSN